MFFYSLLTKKSTHQIMKLFLFNIFIQFVILICVKKKESNSINTYKSYEIFFLNNVTRRNSSSKNARKVFANKCTLIALRVLFKAVPKTR